MQKRLFGFAAVVINSGNKTDCANRRSEMIRSNGLWRDSLAALRFAWAHVANQRRRLWMNNKLNRARENEQSGEKAIKWPL